jgi:secreted PhoX family phosphatase
LSVIVKPGLDTRNWKVQRIKLKEVFEVAWIDLENPDPDEDNLRHGDIFVCEDGDGYPFILGVTKGGDIYKFARNALNASELVGVCFSPDGTSMFANNLESGLTFAITGPWKKMGDF